MGIRYGFKKWLDKMLGRDIPRCIRCGKVLTAEEEWYYDVRCEKCEGRELEKFNNEKG